MEIIGNIIVVQMIITIIHHPHVITRSKKGEIMTARNTTSQNPSNQDALCTLMITVLRTTPRAGIEACMTRLVSFSQEKKQQLR